MDDATIVLPVVAAALVDGNGRVLLQQRPPGKSMAGLWEFPGGKIEVGERPEAALARELCEELGITVVPADLTPAAFASEALGERHLLLLLYVARRWDREPRALEATALAWAYPHEMLALAMPPADVPLVAALAALLDRGAAPD